MQNKCISYWYYACISLSSIFYALSARSIHRKEDPFIPSLTASWAHEKKKYTISDYRLDEYPFFKIFDKEFFYQHHLPPGHITFRNSTLRIESKVLKECVDELVEEIKKKKKKYKHFHVLQAKDFNRRQGHGLLILKFKEYPFVVKLFIERPDTFICPYHKGFEPIFFFYMGGGINRHLAGFTRIKNLEQIKKKIAENAQWAGMLDTPRKWYFVPHKSKWIQLDGKNLPRKDSHQTIEIPGTYCIIADAIDAEKKLSLFDPATDKKLILDLCNYLNLWLDPHLNNYMIEKHTGKLVLVDTEHFASVVGLKEPVTFSNYYEWYLHLTGKFIQNAFGQSKKERKYHQKFSPQMQLA